MLAPKLFLLDLPDEFLREQPFSILTMVDEFAAVLSCGFI